VIAVYAVYAGAELFKIAADYSVVIQHKQCQQRYAPSCYPGPSPRFTCRIRRGNKKIGSLQDDLEL
jgi:hypothetical protein